MARTKTFTGKASPIDELGCEPLHGIVGLELCAQFMQMFDVRLSNGHIVRAFKHKTTRCYLHLDRTEPGLAYRYTDTGRYRLVDLTGALIAVFRDLWRLEPDDDVAQTWLLLNHALDRLETSPPADRGSSGCAPRPELST
jgi:hypothetical protein